MTFEAYLRNIEAKTGKTPGDYFKQAIAEGALRPDTKTMEFVGWLKTTSGLGHGHAMAVWEAFRRHGWVPVQAGAAPARTSALDKREAKR
jgi:hypothetical protein